MTQARILFGQVMHKRLLPKVNRFAYGIYYIAIPLSEIEDIPLAYNRRAILSFYDRDHGPRDGSSLENWARDLLAGYGLREADGEIVLICMPRVFGYVFNPVSFWLCFDRSGSLRAVLCEVDNTFGEHHVYVCAHQNHRRIEHKDLLEGQKVFHVSPMLKREGSYKFRFDVRENQFGVWIDFYLDDNSKQLITSLIGRFEPMNSQTCRRAFWRYPLVTLKAITLIHWQALKLLLKGIGYISKPPQKDEKVTTTNNL